MAESRTTRPDEDQLLRLTITVGPKPLVDGRTIKCPNCEQRQDILTYTPLQYVEKYATDLVPPLKCRSCKHVFALRS